MGILQRKIKMIEPDNPNGVLSTDFKNTYMNAWIDPEGNIYEVGLMGHSNFAMEWIDENDLFDHFYEREDTHWYYQHEYLQYMGWVRVMTWSNNLNSKIITEDFKDPNKKQRDALFDLCMKYDSGLYKEYFQED
jgi:hypothetical protein